MRSEKADAAVKEPVGLTEQVERRLLVSLQHLQSRPGFYHPRPWLSVGQR